MTMKRCLPALAIFFASLAANAEPQVFSSGPERVAVLELFTSQGCSSCPPADRWLSNRRNDEGLWKQWIPLAWHVDYWNYLGWRDKYSSAAYSDRHRSYRHNGGVRVVYTPGFVLDGKEWTRWRYTKAAPRPSGQHAGELSASIDSGNIDLRFQPGKTARFGGYAVHAALLGMGLETQVDSGENHGRTLREDFVVLATESSPAKSGNGEIRWQLPLPKADTADSGKTALVVWVSRRGDPTPLQATGGWL